MKRLPRLALVAVAVVGLSAVALVGRQAPPPGAKMTTAANKFLGTLDADQKKKAAFPFDDPQRTTWFFTPQQTKEKQPLRKGLRMDEMKPDQKAAALELLKTGLSAKGYDQATTIMSLEEILADVEKNGANRRDPNWYFVSVFGEPSNTGSWGWRVEGHHLSVNFTLDKGEVQSPTPLVFGANPAEVRDGNRKGLRTLPEVEDLAKQLIKSLTDEQRKLAQQDKPHSEVKENKTDAGVGPPTGVPAGKLDAGQKETLVKLMQAYADRLPTDIAAAEMKRARDAGIDSVHFGYWQGEATKGSPYTYRVQGPTFVVEFLNVQADGSGNPANHIHSAWRRLPADFALKP